MRNALTFFQISTGCESLLWDVNNIFNMLIEHGLTESVTPDTADIIIIMGCSFSTIHEDEFNKNIATYQKNQKNQLTIVSGCYLTQESHADNLIFTHRDNIIDVIQKFYNIKLKDIQTLQYYKKRDVSFVAISEGCYGQCTYCSVKLVRGQHRSRPISQILSEIKRVSQKHKTVKLIGQDVAAFGVDCNIKISELIRQIFLEEPNLNLELTSLNPYFLNRLTDKELALFADSRIKGNIHIPIQSASNAVLSRMKRNYTCELYEELLIRFKSQGVKHFSTDIIAGFPEETEQDHNRNMQFLSDHKLEFAQIFMYDSRPGTEAASYPQLSKNIRLKRTIELISEYIVSYQLRHEPFSNINDILNTNVDLSKEEIF
jgi:MiaB/RimO family radical SAM methylthiotransferase